MAPSLPLILDAMSALRFCTASRCSSFIALLVAAFSSSIAHSNVYETRVGFSGDAALDDSKLDISVGPNAELWSSNFQNEEVVRSQWSCFDGFYERDLAFQTMAIEHDSKLNALNLPHFNIWVETTPTASVTGYEEYVALHFSDKPFSASKTGFYMFGNSSSMTISMSDGSHRSEQFFTGWKAKIGKKAMFQVDCWMKNNWAMRWCKVVVNGVYYGVGEFLVPGNIYKLDGGQFGQGRFSGKLHLIQVCDGSNGTVENTFVTTTTATVPKEGFHRRRRGTETCDSLPCADWSMAHRPFAERTMCRSKRCSGLDVDLCCKETGSRWPKAPEFSGFPGFDSVPGISGGGNVSFTWSHVMFIMLGLLGIFCCSAGSCTAYMKYKEIQLAKSIFDLEALNAYDYLEVPEQITEEMGQEILHIAKCLLECEARAHKTAKDFWPKVFICCPVVQRPGDAEGCGPGMYYAIAVSILLFQSGIHCFCSLMARELEGEDLLIDKLKSGDSRCEVFMIVQFPGLYLSSRALREINAAKALKIKSIIPLAFERPIPPAEDQWPMIEASETEWLEIREEIAQFMLTSTPLPPDSVVMSPSFLPGVIADIKRALGMDFDMHSI